MPAIEFLKIMKGGIEMSYLHAKVEYIGNTTKEVESVGQIVGINGNEAHVIWDEGVMKGYSSNYNFHAMLLQKDKYRITKMSYEEYLKSAYQNL